MKTELITLCIKNDRRAQKKLYDIHSKALFTMCLKYCKNGTDAEDCLQNTFIKIFRGLATYRGDGCLEGWMKRICINTCIEFLRTKAKKTTEALSEDFEWAYAEENGFDKLVKKDFRQQVSILKRGYKTVLTLYHDGYHHVEIGKLLGISESTSKSQYCRARKILQKKLK